LIEGARPQSSTVGVLTVGARLWTDALANVAVEPDDRDLVLDFESIGDNCELGVLER